MEVGGEGVHVDDLFWHSSTNEVDRFPGTRLGQVLPAGQRRVFEG